MTTVRELLGLVIWLYLIVLFGRLVLDWIRIFARDWRPRGAMLIVAEFVYSLTDPPLRALRKVVPPIRIGAAAIDLAFVILVLSLYVVLAIL